MSLANRLKHGIGLLGLAGLLGITSGCANSGSDKPPVTNDAPYFETPAVLVNDVLYTTTPITINEGDALEITVHAVDDDYDTIYTELDINSQMIDSTWYPLGDGGTLEWTPNSTAGDNPSTQPYQPLFRAWDDSHVSTPTELTVDIYVNDTQ